VTNYTAPKIHYSPVPRTLILDCHDQSHRPAISAQGLPQGQRWSCCCFCHSSFGQLYGWHFLSWPRRGLDSANSATRWLRSLVSANGR
jgi:hypothetical protein